MSDPRFRVIILLGLALIVGAIWTFPSWYPIVNPDTVSVAYPGLPLEAQTDFALLPEEVKQAFFRLRDGDRRSETPPRPAVALALLNARLLGIDLIAPDEIQTAPIPSDARILRRGTFITPDPTRGANGTLVIYQTPDMRRFVRFQDEFSVTRAPNVHIVFTRNPDPYDAQGVGIDYIDVGPLQYTVGTQTYEVPASVDFSRYPILALYSTSLDYVISTATLR